MMINVNRREIENQKIRRILELKTKEKHFQIEIEIKILIDLLNYYYLATIIN